MEIRQLLAQISAERDRLSESLARAEERIRQLDDKLGEAEQAWAMLKPGHAEPDPGETCPQPNRPSVQSKLAAAAPVRDDSLLEDLGLGEAAPYAWARTLVALGADFSDGTEYSLSRPLTTVGRGESVDIKIDGRGISRVHARIATTEDGAIIKDAGSKNGVMVNSRLIDRAELHHGDIVSFGAGHEFRYVEQPLPQPVAI